MVIYKRPLPMGKPKLSATDFRAGFGETETATIFVGADRKEFGIPLKHICSIEYFSQAFSGDFKESESKTIELPDEDPEAFLLFIEWLYRGFSTQQCDHYNVVNWTHLYLTLDKWCIFDVLPAIARQISNILAKEILMEGDAPGEGGGVGSPWTRLEAKILRCYEIAHGHKLRMLFVHASEVMNRTWLPRRLIGENSESGFDTDLLRWVYFLRDTVDRSAREYDIKDLMNSEVNAHTIDTLLLPLLFDSEAWPTYQSHMPSSDDWADYRENERKYWRDFLKM